MPVSSKTRPWDRHGDLKVSTDGHQIEHKDGTGFFWLGDTAWGLLKLDIPDLERYLESRAARGFNVIQFVALWGGHLKNSEESPFVGSGPPWARAEFNQAYWHHVDDVVQACRDHGLYAAILAWWGPNADNPTNRSGQVFSDPDTQNYVFGKTLGARYSEQPHIIWVGSGEFQHPYYYPPTSPEHLERHQKTLAGIRDGDGGRHLCTIHPGSRYSCSEEFDPDLLDFHMIQSHVYQTTIVPLVSDDWERESAKPTLNAEAWYEGEEELWERKTGLLKVPDPDRGRQKFDPAWIQRYQAYWSVLAGGIGFTYGHQNLWTMTDITWLYAGSDTSRRGVLLDSALNGPGSATLCHLRSFMESLPTHTRVPDRKLILSNTRGYTGTLSPTLRIASRGEDRSWAVVYSTRGQVVGVAMGHLAPDTVRAHWYDPRTGQWKVGEELKPDKTAFIKGIPSGRDAPNHYFHPPGTKAGPGGGTGSSRDGNDWVLLLEVE